MKGSFYSTTYEAELILGDIDNEIVKDESEIAWSPVVDSSYWAINLYRAKIGNRLWIKEYKALIDSGTSCIFVPPSIFYDYLDTI